MDGLTYKQRRFIEAYLGEARGNASEAARLAGYAKPAEQGYENLRKPQIRAAIDARIEELGMAREEVLAAVVDQARLNPEPLFEVVGPYEVRLNFEAAQTAGLLRYIKKFSYNAAGLPVIEFTDRQAALALLAKYYGLDRPREAEEALVEDAKLAEALGAATAEAWGEDE